MRLAPSVVACALQSAMASRAQSSPSMQPTGDEEQPGVVEWTRPGRESCCYHGSQDEPGQWPRRVLHSTTPALHHSTTPLLHSHRTLLQHSHPAPVLASLPPIFPSPLVSVTTASTPVAVVAVPRPPSHQLRGPRGAHSRGPRPSQGCS